MIAIAETFAVELVMSSYERNVDGRLLVIPGPYTKEWRETWLKKLLAAQTQIRFRTITRYYFNHSRRTKADPPHL